MWTSSSPRSGWGGHSGWLGAGEGSRSSSRGGPGCPAPQPWPAPGPGEGLARSPPSGRRVSGLVPCSPHRRRGVERRQVLPAGGPVVLARQALARLHLRTLQVHLLARPPPRSPATAEPCCFPVSVSAHYRDRPLQQRRPRSERARSLETNGRPPGAPPLCLLTGMGVQAALTLRTADVGFGLRTSPRPPAGRALAFASRPSWKPGLSLPQGAGLRWAARVSRHGAGRPEAKGRPSAGSIPSRTQRPVSPASGFRLRPAEWLQYHPLAPNKLQPCGERRFYKSRYF